MTNTAEERAAKIDALANSIIVLAPTRIPGKTAALKTRLPFWQTQKADGLDYHRLGGGDCFERGA